MSWPVVPRNVSLGVQRWESVGELGPIHKCDKLFGYVSACFGGGAPVFITVSLLPCFSYLLVVSVSCRLMQLCLGKMRGISSC